MCPHLTVHLHRFPSANVTCGACLQQTPAPLPPARSQPGPPPTDSLGAFPEPMATCQGFGRSQKPLLLGPSALSMPHKAGGEAAPAFGAGVRGRDDGMAVAPGLWGAAGAHSGKGRESAVTPSFGAWGKYIEPAATGASFICFASALILILICKVTVAKPVMGTLLPVCIYLDILSDTLIICCDSGPASSSVNASSWGRPPAGVEKFGKTAAPSGQMVGLNLPLCNTLAELHTQLQITRPLS